MPSEGLVHSRVILVRIKIEVVGVRLDEWLLVLLLVVFFEILLRGSLVESVRVPLVGEVILIEVRITRLE